MKGGHARIQSGCVLALYSLLALAIFSPLGAAGRLAGNCDSWLAIALSNTYAATLASWLRGSSIGTSLYPWGIPFAYGESSPLGALLFGLFKLIRMDDVGAHTAWLATLFSFSAWGVFLLARTFGLPAVAAFFAGFAFSVSNFAFANIDDSIITCFFLPCLSLVMLRRGKLSGAAIAGGLQVYLSVYVFVYQSLALAIYVIVGQTIGLRRIWSPALLYLAISAPLISAYLWIYAGGETYNLLARDPAGLLAGRGLDVSALFASLPGGLIYTGSLPEGPEFWLALRKKAFLGFALLALAGLGALHARELRRFALGLCALGLVLAWGQPLSLGGLQIPPPLLWVYELSPAVSALRIPLRAYFLTSLGLSLLAAAGVSSLLGQSWAKGRMVPILLVSGLCGLHAAENLPLPLRSFEGKAFASVPTAYLETFAADQRRVILDLPTTTFRDAMLGPVHADLYAYNREVIYMNWQTQHRQNILGGIHGYDFEARRALLEQVQSVPEADALEVLSEVGLEYITFHPGFVLPGEEPLAEALRAARGLELVVDREEIQIYRLIGRPVGGE